MKKFLIVDDEPFNCKLLKEILSEVAYCDAVYNGTEALKIFQASYDSEVPYDMVLLDITMPDIDGLEVLEGMRKFEEERGINLGKGIPVIMVTAVEKTFMEAFKKGAEDYILKPIEREKVLKKVSEQLKD